MCTLTRRGPQGWSCTPGTHWEGGKGYVRPNRYEKRCNALPNTGCRHRILALRVVLLLQVGGAGLGDSATHRGPRARAKTPKPTLESLASTSRAAGGCFTHFPAESCRWEECELDSAAALLARIAVCIADHVAPSAPASHANALKRQQHAAARRLAPQKRSDCSWTHNVPPRASDGRRARKAPGFCL